MGNEDIFEIYSGDRKPFLRYIAPLNKKVLQTKISEKAHSIDSESIDLRIRNFFLKRVIFFLNMVI